MRRIFQAMVALGMATVIPGREEPVAKTIPMPENYREWVWLSSGLGMSYTQGGAESDSPEFDNVFASPEAYKVFKETGTWPAKTMLMLELRKSGANASINKHGHFQTNLAAIEAHVKDEHGQWAFYSFSNGTKSGTLFPKSASCYSCHEQHAAVDTTFVQFYPTLLEIAKAKGKVDHPSL